MGRYVKSLAKSLLTEMALDLGGARYFDPERRQKLASHGHPYGQNPGFPRETEAHPNYAEGLASEQFQKISQKIARATGIPVDRQNPSIIAQMFQAFQEVLQIEHAHKEDLEFKAVELVLSMPEFSNAKTAYNDGALRIFAELKSSVSTEDMTAEPEDPSEQQKAELQVAEIARELDVEKAKRRMVNMMIQGAAINKNHAYHLISDQLSEIDPRLENLYSILMSVAEYSYWVTPLEGLNAMMGSGEGAAGKARFKIGEDGVPEIHAEAVVFPVLVQELTKGLMEFLSYDEDMPPETMAHVYGQEDTMSNEIWDIMLGPAAWRRFLQAVGNENHDILDRIYMHLNKLPAEQFSRTLKSILSGSPDGKRYLDNLIADIRTDLQESKKSLIDRLLG